MLLSSARRWVGKAHMRAPPPRANAPATPTVPGLDSARERTANHHGPCQTWGFVMWADVYKGPERGQADTYCDLSLKRTQRASTRLGDNAGQPVVQSLPIPPTSIDAGNNEGRCTLWTEPRMALCSASGICVDSLCPCARRR